MSTLIVPVNLNSTRLEHPVKVVSNCEVTLLTSKGEFILTRELQLWNISPTDSAEEVSMESISVSEVQP